jgi:hypothetical protein
MRPHKLRGDGFIGVHDYRESVSLFVADCGTIYFFCWDPRTAGRLHRWQPSREYFLKLWGRVATEIQPVVWPET